MEVFYKAFRTNVACENICFNVYRMLNDILSVSDYTISNTALK